MKPNLLAVDRLVKGEKKCVRLPITTALGGHEISLWVHAIRGAKDGPTLALLSAVHGDEWFGTEFLRRVVEEIDPAQLSGTILAVPVGNPPALEILKRTVPDEAGGSDLNRSFPGATMLVTDRIAATLVSEVLSQADALLDFHQGDWGVTWASVGYPADLPDLETRARAEAMATAYGYPAIHRSQIITGRVGRGSACGYVGVTYNTPSLAVSIGGVGFAPAVETEWIDAASQGIFNVMRHLGMVEGDVPPPPRRLVFEKSWYVRPRVGGLLKSAIPVERLLTQVEKGELLGWVISPYTFEVLEELVAPAPGILHSLCRDYPVQPGNWAYAGADLTVDSTEWLEAGW